MPLGHDLRIEKLSSAHSRDDFDCGEESLDVYLKRFARQNAKRGLGTTYVVVENGATEVQAYYTISSGQVTEERQGLPGYPVPVVRIGRLAVNKSVEGQGIGGIILIDALKRALAISEALGIYAVELDALTDTARSFYKRYGFEALQDDERHLYISIRTVRRLFGE